MARKYVIPFLKRLSTSAFCQITYNDFKELKQLLPEERAHISVIVMETKKRVEIIYFTKLLSLLVNLWHGFCNENVSEYNYSLLFSD
jgi:hypothetical protein